MEDISINVFSHEFDELFCSAVSVVAEEEEFDGLCCLAVAASASLQEPSKPTFSCHRRRHEKNGAVECAEKNTKEDDVGIWNMGRVAKTRTVPVPTDEPKKALGSRIDDLNDIELVWVLQRYVMEAHHQEGVKYRGKTLYEICVPLQHAVRQRRSSSLLLFGSWDYKSF